MGSLWKVEGERWDLRLVPRSRAAGEAPLRVFLTECLSAVVDGGRWAHEASYWLYHDANVDLTVSLPRGGRVLGVTVDGLAVTPLQPSIDRLWIPLPGAAGARHVRVSWMFPAEVEPLQRPHFEVPRIHPVGDSPVAWVVYLPPRYSMILPVEETRPRMMRSSGSALDLSRAEAQYQLSGLLAGQPRGGALPVEQLAALQRRFYQLVRYAAHAHTLAGPRPETNLQGKGLDEWLQELQENNRRLAEAHGFEDLRLAAESEALSDASSSPMTDAEVPDLGALALVQAPGRRGDWLVPRGTPVYWLTGPGVQALPLGLRADEDRDTKRAMASSVLVVVFLLGAWVLAQLPSVLAWVRAFWPEQLALVGYLVWQVHAPGLFAILLILMGAATRVLFLARRLLSWLPHTEVPSTPPARSGSSGSEPRTPVKGR
jgi:hypothetical protein